VSLKAASNFNIETDETIFGIVSVGVPLSLSQFESPHLQAMGLINDMDMIDRVSYHNTSIGAIVAEAMAKRNCKKVAVLSRDTPLCLERKRTFCLEAEAHGMHVMPFEPKLQDAYKAYSQHTNLPDAIFATEDSYLPALYAVLAMQNIKPMEDLLIIGCNAQKSVLYQCQPTPWSVDLQLPAIATHCLNQLNMRRAHPNHPPVHISLTPVLNKGEPLCSVTL
jgi:DNA-binding LacI/PurR family transcriptional regulator